MLSRTARADVDSASRAATNYRRMNDLLQKDIEELRKDSFSLVMELERIKIYVRTNVENESQYQDIKHMISAVQDKIDAS
jgi:hypothetical protein